MRRLALSLVATCGLAALTACSGGYGLNTGGNKTPTSIVFTNGSGGVNDFFVSYGGSAPVLVAATAVNGTGATSTVIPDVQFTWAATYLPKGTIYYTGGSPNGQSECGAPSQLPGINSLLQQGTGGNPYPFFGGYTQLGQEVTINGNPTYGQQTSQIFVGPPLIPNGPDPSMDITPVPVAPATAGGTYCLQVIATAVPSGVKGGVTVVVEP